MDATFKDLLPSVLTAIATGALGLPAFNWTFARIYRPTAGSGFIATLLLAVAATAASSAVFGTIALGVPAALATWPPRGSVQIYMLGMLAGAIVARALSGRRRGG